MPSYMQFDMITQTKKSKLLKIIANIVIISVILVILLFNIYTKDDVKIIFSNSRRIISTLNNYTETMSDFMVSNQDSNDISQLNEIKNIRLSIDYFKDIKEKELKEILEIQIKQEKLKLEDIKQKELENKKNAAINLIKAYIPNYNVLFNLVSSHQTINGYSNNFNCLKRIIKINNEELFNKLIKIDYDKSEVSFNYLEENEEYYKNTDNIITSHLYTDYDANNNYYNYSHYIYKNYKENIMKNPIYQIIKNTLEVDYSYTEPNLTDHYNNKSKYFQQSLNEFSKINYDYQHLDKYYENYENDTYYLYYKSYFNHKNYMGITVDIDYEYTELLIKNKILINNQNPKEIYNKNPYKFKCNIPSRSINNKPSIRSLYTFGKSYFGNWCYGRTSNCGYELNKYNIENILNYVYVINDYNTYYGNIELSDYPGGYFHYYSSVKNYELDKNKGSRMVKHNLTNNIPEYFNKYLDWLRIQNYYFIENVFIDFPLISIYDEYEYIQMLIEGIANINDLPIIPPIKFI